MTTDNLAKRFATFVAGDGGIVPASSNSSFDAFLRSNVLPSDVPRDSVWTIAGAILGGAVFLNERAIARGGRVIRTGTHPYLGLIGGASLGRNMPALFTESTRKMALQNMTETGAGITASLIASKFKNLPVVGGILPIFGFAVGYVGLSYWHYKGQQ